MHGMPCCYDASPHRVFLQYDGKVRGAKTKPAPSVFATEGLVERLTRLAGILRVCCGGGLGADVGRAVKVLEKLKQVRLRSSLSLCRLVRMIVIIHAVSRTHR